jgi:hypothetical protein
MATKTTERMEIRRWISCCAKPGQLRARARVVVVRPSNIVAVRRMRAIRPLARVAYQRLVELTTPAPWATR